MVLRSRYESVRPYVTKDGSVIRELMHPAVHGNENLSLAEAIVPPGFETALHRHLRSEEVYHVLEGRGLMTLGDERFEVEKGDCVCIRPGTVHQIENRGDSDLRILCCCAPPYSHDDTELV